MKKTPTDKALAHEKCIREGEKSLLPLIELQQGGGTRVVGAPGRKIGVDKLLFFLYNIDVS